ncbi:MAG: ZIP family metal transporter [Alphaproteobacteria bacterium]|jgi:ZIP family zinc transporter|nr:ZIP family metal transporter [Alphaproteobacteria bacterium]
MWSEIQAPLFFGLVAAFVTSIGLVAVAQRSEWTQRHANLFGLAAGGMLVTLTVMHIAPEAFARTDRAPAWLLGGFLAGLVLNHLARSLPTANGPCERPVDALTPVAAIAIHSFIDGIIYAVTFAASFASGVYAALALILHEFPEGVIAFAILRKSGVSSRKAFLWAFLAAAATTPLGVVLSSPVMSMLGDERIGQLYALSAGLLLYVATGPLLAPARDEPPFRGLGAIATGVAAAIALIAIPLPHGGHGHGPVESHRHHDHGAHPEAPDFR